MPKILARDPAWLARATPSAQLFRASGPAAQRAATAQEHEGASRRIAQRGSEVFVAVGNEVRWSELGLLKDAGEQSGRQQARDQDGAEKLYRVCRWPGSMCHTQELQATDSHARS